MGRFFRRVSFASFAKTYLLLTERPDVHLSSFPHERMALGMDIWPIIPMRNMLIADRGHTIFGNSYLCFTSSLVED